MAILNLINNPSKPSQDFINNTWTAVQGCTVRRSTKYKQTGDASLGITGTATTAATRSNTIGGEYMPQVSGLKEYRGVVNFFHDSIGRSVSLGIIFYDATGAVISTGTTFSASASQTTTTVTVTTSVSHGLQTGAMISLSGFSAQPALNLKERVITVTGSTTFTIQADDSATRSGTGGTVSVLSCTVAAFQMGYTDWTQASVTAISPSNAVYSAIQVVFSSIDTASKVDPYLWIDNPSITSTDVPSSDWYSGMLEDIPDFVEIADASQSNPNYPLARYVDLVASKGQEILDLYNAINYVSVADGGEVGDTSALVDPSKYPDSETKTEWLPWLSQLLATKSITVPGGSTSWAALTAAYSTWDGWEDNINAAAAPVAVAISARSRTSGISTITTSASHGLAVGDSVVISGAGTYNGVHLVTSVLSATQFTFSQIMPLLDISRSGTTVTATVGLAHNYLATNSVVIAGTGTALDGTFAVVSVSTTDDLPNVFTYTTVSSGTLGPFYTTGSTYPANDTSAAAGTAQIGSDLNWTSLEQFAPYPIDPNSALAYLLRTGATGIWAGTVEGLKRAARLPLNGWDIQSTMSCSGGVMTVTTESPHTLTTADQGITQIEIYGTPDDGVNRVYTVSTVVSTTKFTVSCGPKTEEFSGWATNKLVDVVRGFWSGVPSTISVTGGVMTATFNTKIPFGSSTAPVTIIGTGNVSVDTTHSPASVTIAADRMSASWPTAVTLASPLTPSDARVRLTANRFAFVVKTLNSQTEGAGIVLAFADQAKPAGSAISHEYKT